ncbi:MAG: hypothetical protein II369_03210, partial [Clostridia bacterium]|nr:hypothetical protein [Clostridia bacterium]
YFSLVVQFSRISSPPLTRRLAHYTTSAFTCQGFFAFFSKNLFKFWIFHPLGREPTYFIIFQASCQAFFDIFFAFFRFCLLCLFCMKRASSFVHFQQLKKEGRDPCKLASVSRPLFFIKVFAGFPINIKEENGYLKPRADLPMHGRA